MSEQDLINNRKSKHQELNGGEYSLPSFGDRWTINAILNFIRLNQHMIPNNLSMEDIIKSSVPCVSVYGRIKFFRKSGSIAFLSLEDQSNGMQLILTKSLSQGFDKIKLMDLGDIIEVHGYPCMSKTGEPSVLVIEWNLLTKAVRPMPEKFAGITDTEIKYRKRYLDLLSDRESQAVFAIRSGVIRALRDFMGNEGFMEVETSTLSNCISGANAKPFITHHNALGQDLYLRVAPELNLKRLLVGGFEKVYEIGKSYRNEGIDTRHNPEFSMMEYYEAYGKFPSLIARTQQLLSYVEHACAQSLPGFASDLYKNMKKDRSYTLTEYKILTMWEAIIHGANKANIFVNPFTLPSSDKFIYDLEFGDPNERTHRLDMAGLVAEFSAVQSPWSQVGILFEYLAEPFLTEDYRTADNKYSVPVFITQYPRAISPLARSLDSNPDLTERFELFLDGRELCNAFQELNDPAEQSLRFKEQSSLNAKDPMDYDADYIEALECGMPPAIGFGIGIDRLVMVLTNRSNIKDVILFPTLKSEK